MSFSFSHLSPVRRPDIVDTVPDRRRRLLLWLLPLLVLDVWLVRRWWRRRPTPAPAPASVSDADETPPSPASPRRWRLAFPTPQTRLLDEPTEDIFMPTASGRIESALYGSTRTRESGGRIIPSFHEGIDIAPTMRDRRGRPLDPVFAAGDGRVAYLQPHAGNSNYGIYVVLLHDDPLGEVYTLYAHLDRIAPGLSAGDPVVAGQEIGRMGHTPSSIIPLVRAHLHFEIGLVRNLRFERWYRMQREKPDHGNWHGMNLDGVNPLAAFSARSDDGMFSMANVLETTPAAFELACRVQHLPDYFIRYPGLWQGPLFEADRPAIVLTVCAGGVVLRGRTASAEEANALGAQPHCVLAVDENLLSRNGRGLIGRNGGAWRLTSNGEQWLESLLFHPNTLSPTLSLAPSHYKNNAQ